MLHELLATLRGEGRSNLLEQEGMELLASHGITVPGRRLLEPECPLPQGLLDSFPGERVVLKLQSPEVLHKSEAGGVRVLPKKATAITEAMAEMRSRHAGGDLRPFLLCEFVPYRPDPGREWLIGYRLVPDFGPVVLLGPGGIHAEALAGMGAKPLLFQPHLQDAEDLRKLLQCNVFSRFLIRPQRGAPPLVEPDELVELLLSFGALARELAREGLGEFEINPLVRADDGRLVALDALGKIAEGSSAPAAPRPIDRIRCLLEPRSLAVIGVSQKMNPGRIIVENLLKLGYPRDGITILKPGTDELAGCRCVPTLSDLEQPVDLLVCSVGAAQVPGLVGEACRTEKAQSLVLIPGGMEEKEGGREAVKRMHEELAASRRTRWGGPVLNGGNCVGLRSLPGKVDTLFIPDHKIPPARTPGIPLAIVSQSGAYLVSLVDRLGGLSPRYALSIGNQTDLTVGDYLEYLARDEELEQVAVYMEGFKPGDGERFLRAARLLVRRGVQVRLYMAGRTPAGAKASASHTASIAGDHAVARALAEGTGLVFHDSLEEFAESLRLDCLLRGKSLKGLGVAGLSNAGFECVSLADSLSCASLATPDEKTLSDLKALLASAGLGDLVDAHNPLDLTPMAGADVTLAAMQRLLEDPGVSAGVLGCVPMTPALETLPLSLEHKEDFRRPGGLAEGMIRLFRESEKPLVFAVDAGASYVPLVEFLKEEGLPVYSSIERAAGMLDRWMKGRAAGE